MPLGASRGAERGAATGKPGEVGLALLQVGVSPFLSLLGHVEEEVRVMGELLDPGQPILIGVEARLEHAQRKRRHDDHLPTPADRLSFELVEGNNGVDQPHLESLLRVVLAAQEPDLLGLLGPHEPGKNAGPEAAVE
jgi:hypothetical protein